MHVADLAASFQQAVIDVLVAKARTACRRHGADTLLMVGGVALRVPPPLLCTDNGAMIAALGDLLVRTGAPPAPLDMSAAPSAVLHSARLPAPTTPESP